MKRLHTLRRFVPYFFACVKLALTRPASRRQAQKNLMIWSVNVALAALITGMNILLGFKVFTTLVVVVLIPLNGTMFFFTVCGWFWRKDQDEFERLMASLKW
jgi:hypothetical protein